MLLLRERLEHYLAENGIDSPIVQLTPDASTRRYFRFQRDGRSVVACVYPDDIKHAAHNYIDVTGLFRRNGLPVADVFDFDEVRAIIVVEDLGDTILRPVLEQADDTKRTELTCSAIKLIAQIQGATSSANESNSIASRLKFDVEKLMWELNYFKIHYFSTYKKQPLDAEIDSELDAEFMQLSSELENAATTLCHRDFHAANLMIDQNGDLRIIDHQDARMGSPTYDLVSLLLDRVTDLPSDEWLNEMKSVFKEERRKVGLADFDPVDFDHEFDLQTIQRCLKAAGTFSFQSAVREKAYFIPFIDPMFRIVHSTLTRIDRFPTIRKVLEAELAAAE